MCEKWSDSFEAFYADMGTCPPGYTLDRIDNDRGYEPGNCRWATQAEQERNKRNSVKVVLNGVGMNLVDYADAIGVNYRSMIAVMSRLKIGPEDAVQHLLSSTRYANSPRRPRGRAA